MPDSIPDSVVDKAVSLTHRSRREDDSSFKDKRDEILSEHNYNARVRDEDDVLVLYPTDWLDENRNVHPEHVESFDKAVEIPLSGSRDDANWEEVEKVNSEVVKTIREKYGDTHGDNAREFADFMGNHRLKKIPNTTEQDKEEFLEHYFQRNVWATDEQESVVEESLQIITDVIKDEYNKGAEYE